ncbi:MAG: PEGA domain-containing protein [Candidatus Latescibacterota bacterium]
MKVSPEEAQRLREEIRSRLAQTLEAKKRTESLEEKRREERILEQERQAIFDEEERAFYEAQGLKKYYNRHGAVEWLTPKDIKQRYRSGRERYRVRKEQKRVKHWVSIGRAFIAVLILAGLGGALYRMWLTNLPEEKGPTTVVWVRSNVQGAAIYVDEQLTGMVTDGVIKDLAAGKHNLAVALPGYLAIPKMQEIQVASGDTIALSFELTADYW